MDNSNIKNASKNVCIVTWFSTSNYGTCLQSYSLYIVIGKLGFNTYISRSYRYPDTVIGGIKDIVKCLIPSNLICRRNNNKMYTGDSILKIKKILEVGNVYNDVTPYNFWGYRRLVDKMNIFVTGSDQLWNTRNYYDPFMFLSFARNKRRIAYGTSIGIKDFQESIKPQIKEFLSKYSFIGVREESAKKVVARLTGRDDIVNVLDPTFLLTKTEWDSFCNSNNLDFSLPENYILCYFIGNNTKYINDIYRISHNMSIETIIQIESSENRDFVIDKASIYKDGGPREFVYLIKNASIICTDSYHALVFSIIYSKRFVVFKRFPDENPDSQNSRIYDLLYKFGLTETLSRLKNDYSGNNEIDYNSLQEKLCIERNKSLSFLEKSLGKTMNN